MSSTSPCSKPTEHILKKSGSGLKLLRRFSFNHSEDVTSVSNDSKDSNIIITTSSGAPTLDSDYRTESCNSEASSSGTTLSSSPNATTISSRDRSFLISSPSSGRALSDSKHTRATSLSLYSTDSYRYSNLKGSKSEVNSRRSSLSRKSGKRNGSGSFSSKERWMQEFKALDSELARFVAKSGVNKTNILRLALLTFLRQSKGFPDNYDGPKHLYPCSPFSSSASSAFNSMPQPTSSTDARLDFDTSFKIRTLQKWWSHILMALKQRNAVNGADRSAYLEGLSGIMSRPEWLYNTTSYRVLLTETLQLTINKLELKNVPLFMSAFAGKVFVYSFFWIPGVAQVLINSLNLDESLAQQVSSCCFDKQISLEFHLSIDDLDFEDDTASSASSLSGDDSAASYETINLNKAVHGLKPYFFDHLHPMMGFKGKELPLDPAASISLVFLTNPGSIWARRWSCIGSDLFMSFIKHYYSVISMIFLQSKHKSPWVNTHLAAPGLLVFHGYILRELNTITKGPERKFRMPTNDYDSVAITAIPSMGKRRVDQLKALSVIREILHNDEFSVQFYERYCRQFENILHAVALSTPLHDMDSCVVFTDLAEEYLASLILTHPLSTQRVLIYKDKAIEWDFWINVAQKMLETDSSFTELRALSFLFNIWEHIPLGMGSQSFHNTNTNTNSNAGQSSPGFDLYDEYDSYRWRLTTWLLSPEMWKKFFCHWQPLVRAYYHRLLCWRIASVGPESDLLSSVLFSNYIADARALLSRRLKLTSSNVQRLISHDINISFEPCLPVLHRKLKIGANMAASAAATNIRSSRSSLSPPTSVMRPSSTGLLLPSVASSSSVGFSGRIDPYDVFDDIAYSYLVSKPPATVSSPLGNKSMTVIPQSESKPSLPAQTDNFAGESPTTTPTKKLGRITSLTSFFRRKSSPSIKASNQEILNETPKNLRKYIDNGIGAGNSVDSNMSDMKKSIDYVRPSADQVAADTPPRAYGAELSLTMSLVPPPPQLLRPQPELRRPIYRFGLEYCESSMRKQMDLVMGKKRRTPDVTVYRLRLLGRLPFDYSRSANQSEDLLELYNDKASSKDYLSAPQTPSSFKDDLNSVYLTANSSPNPVDLKPDIASVNIGKQMLMDEDDVKYWKYAGRSLSEWEQVVCEFEAFVRSSKMISGVSRLEDIKAPFLVAEIPAKAFGAV